MSTRLPYETKGGNFSPGETHAQLSEYLKLAAECCYALGHYDKANDDNTRGDNFIKVGQKLEEMQRLVLMLSTIGARQ